MKKSLFTPLLAAGLIGLSGNISTVSATNYAGNGGNNFGGAVGTGTLSVTNNGTGGFTFAFTLGGSMTSYNSTNNDLVFYIDNGKGSGIGTSTASLTDTGDNSRIPTSQYNGTSRSTLSFGSLMSPQYAIDLSPGQANIFQINNTASNFGYGGGSNLGSTTTQGGVTYALSGSTYTLNVPAAAIGLTSFSGATLKLLAINVSNTGFSSNEATVTLTGSSGYGNTQTIGGVNSFTAAPEPGTWAMLAVGGLGGLAMICRRQSRAR